MATTTNYAWETPDDTDLVKDGASAIRTLGSSIDTTTKALNPSTTLGDIEYRSATANTNTRLGIGSTGQVLTVTGGVPVWETISAGGMTLLSTTSLSGATTTISSISQSYTDLVIYVYGVTNATADGIFRLAPNGTTNISDLINTWNNTINTSQASYTNLTNVSDTAVMGSNVNAWSVTISNYANTVGFKPIQFNGRYYGNTFGVRTAITGSGTVSTTSAISSLVFSNSGGDLSTGTVLVYGVK
jgi:hypothetical protein